MTKRFIYSTILKLFIRFLHYIIMLPAFQPDRLACTIVQFRKFIYGAPHKNINLYKLRKQKQRKCDSMQSPDYETVKRS